MSTRNSQVSGPLKCLPMTKSRRANNWRQIQKKETSRKRRRAAKVNMEDAPVKGYKGWSW